MYIPFILPQLEYASVVWEGCRAIDSEKTRQINTQPE